MDTWRKERKIVTHPSAEVTPQIVLARSLDKAKRMKGVAVVIIWDDDSVSADWSDVKLSELCFMSKKLDMDIETLWRE